MSFRDLALPLAIKNIPVIRLYAGEKRPIDNAWQMICTTDTKKILAWDKESPNAGCAAVAKADGVLFFESDVEGTIGRYEKETGEVFPDTIEVQSSPGHRHYYFLQTPESRACGNISQNSIPFGSLRQNNAYVVASGSIHPKTKQPYQTIKDSPLAPIPAKFIEWLLGQAKREEKASAPSVNGERARVPHGQHDSTLAFRAGQLRKANVPYEDAIEILTKEVEELYDGYGTDYIQMVQKCVKSIYKKPAGLGVPDCFVSSSSTTAATATTMAAIEPEVISDVPDEELEQEEESEAGYDEYPYWTWNNTLYEKFSTIAGRNNLIPKEFLLEACKTTVGAICGHRITPYQAPGQEARFYSLFIAPAGTGKSTAAKWATNMFAGTGLLYGLSQFGAYTNIGAVQCRFSSAPGMIKNGFSRHSRLLLVYDEATTLIEKCSIAGSGLSFMDLLNELYEETSNCPSLGTKDDKDGVTKAVHVSALMCTTAERWDGAFTKTQADGSGYFQRLNIISNACTDSVPNLLEPDLLALRDEFVRKILPLEYQKMVVVKTPEAIAMLEKWFEDQKPRWKKLPLEVTGRIQVLIQRNISHLAWMLDGDRIPKPEAPDEIIEVICDENIMERAIALAEFELYIRPLHRPIMAENPWAKLECLIRRYMVKHGAKPVLRSTLGRAVNADRYGTKMFNSAIQNLVEEGFIRTGRKDGDNQRGRRGQYVVLVTEKKS